MNGEFTKSDWKQFKKVRERALERLCERALKDIVGQASDESRSHHERFLAVYQNLHKYNKDIASAFDGLSRSRMMMQLAIMKRLNLLDESDMECFTVETRNRIQLLTS